MVGSDPLSGFPPTRACLFDMDGLLINSEDLYTRVTNEVLHKYGKGDLPWAIKAQLQGRPRAEANQIFHTWANLPISKEQYYEEQDALQAQYFLNTEPLPGTDTLLKSLKSAGVELALATSSHKGNFFIKTNHLKEYMSPFTEERRVLGDDPRIPKGRGKPAPDIYLVALETVNKDLEAQGKTKVTPRECLVFEDSVPGVEAGRRAGMRVVWCPHPGLLKEFQGREAEVLAGLIDNGEPNGSVDSTNSVVAEKKEAGWPGQINDGWGQLLHTLEDFPYAKYGITPKN